MRVMHVFASAAALMIAMTVSAGAQSSQRAPGAAQPPTGSVQPSAPAPYKPVAVTLPKGTADASLDAFRNEIGEIAERKDRAALASRVSAKGFKWERADGKMTDARRSGFDQLAAAIDLSNADGSGWDTLASIVADGNVGAVPGLPNMLCAPAVPRFDEAQLDRLAQATQSDPLEWVYPVSAGIEVRAKGDEAAPVIERLGSHFVRVVEDAARDNESPAGEWLRIATPSGRIGFVRFDQIGWLETDKICYAKEGSAWKIAGYIGGGE
jgi:hypothetical protein